MRVEDPCQAKDNNFNINLNPRNTTVKDLKYHEGTDSLFWLRKMCQDAKALSLLETDALPFLALFQGNLAILSTLPDQCTRLEVQHSAPDDSTIINVLYLHMMHKFEATIESCSPTHGDCQPNIEDLALKSTAGQSKTVTLFEQESVENYIRACEGALFDLTDAPFWLSLTNSYSLVIDAPNNVNIPGEYKFWISIWAVTLEIAAPCNSTYL